MLTRFSVENLYSFHARAEFSMVAGKSTRHKDHVIKAGHYNDFNRLKSAVIYGANAAGKSNLVRAINFMKTMVLAGTPANSRIPVHKFLLAADNNKPSRLEIEIAINGNNYAYGFVLDENRIHEEWLLLANKKNEKEIYSRKVDSNGAQDIACPGLNFHSVAEESLFSSMAMQCPGNQLIISEYIKNRERLQPQLQQDALQALAELCHWFNDKLQIIFPETVLLDSPAAIPGMINSEKLIAELLHCFDTGITNIKLSAAPPEQLQAILPAETWAQIHRDTQEGHDGMVMARQENNRYLYTRKDNNIFFQKICAEHETADGTPVVMDFSQESDGTKRLFDLLPAYLNTLHQNASVLIIDEIDRSLHPQIASALLQNFYATNPAGQSQLIITTHETGLLDQDLVRKDEIWFVDKKKGASSLYSLEEFLPRYDKDIRTAYLKGRFGAMPIIEQDPAIICQQRGVCDAT